MPQVHDEEFLAALGVPRDELDRAFEWEGWTAGMVKKALARMAAAAELPPEKLLGREGTVGGPGPGQGRSA